MNEIEIEIFKKAIENTNYFLLDMDGTIYIEDEIIGDMTKTLDVLRENGKAIIYLTNNSSKSVDTYINKLKKLNLYREKDVVYTSGLATINFLENKYNNSSVFVLGTENLKEEFRRANIRLVENQQPDVAVLAYDTELNYDKLTKFITYIERGAIYIATHPDINCPAKDIYLPDVGSFMSLIETSTNLKPTRIIGKPNTDMGVILKQKYNCNNTNFMMVGDRLKTDILFGNNCGFYSLLVLSGETTKEDLLKSNIKPNFVLNSLNDIVNFI